MDTSTEYRDIIKNVLTEYAALRYALGDIQRITVFDQPDDHYLIMLTGWDQKGDRVHGCLLHIDLIDHKCWVQRDGTEHGITRDLEAAGIPKEDIVLAFQPPYVRPHTGYAVA